jgi:hypothetical protein
LYNLKDDPHEEKNRAADKWMKLKAMVGAWGKWKASVEASDQGADY